MQINSVVRPRGPREPFLNTEGLGGPLRSGEGAFLCRWVPACVLLSVDFAKAEKKKEKGFRDCQLWVILLLDSHQVWLENLGQRAASWGGSSWAGSGTWKEVSRLPCLPTPTSPKTPGWLGSPGRSLYRFCSWEFIFRGENFRKYCFEQFVQQAFPSTSLSCCGGCSGWGALVFRAAFCTVLEGIEEHEGSWLHGYFI